MDIEITGIVSPSMYPVTADIAAIRVGDRTVADVIRARVGVLPPDCGLSVSGDFLLPPELLVRLLEMDESVIVTDAADGTELLRLIRAGREEAPAEITLAPGPERLRYPWDLLALNEEIVEALAEDEVLGRIYPGAVIEGRLRLGAGSVILPGVYIEGNAVFGENCKIGPNCYIRGNTTVGDFCHIGQAVEIKNSLLMNKVSVGHLSYVGDSVISSNVNFGAGTIVSNLRHDGKNHRYRVNGALIDTGRRKFGAVIGENVHTGIHSAIYPGRALPPGTETHPGQIVEK